jgi:hypothetical protein
MVLNNGLDSSLDNMQEWKQIRETARRINSMNMYITDGYTSLQLT